MNSKMLHVVATKIGGYDAIEILSALPQHPKPKEIVVAVKSCGINFFDNYIRLGLSPDVKPPCVLGLECAGIVEALGVDVTNVKINDHVIVHCPHGGAMSQYVTVDESQVLSVPSHVEFSKAASLTINYLTAFFTLIEVGGLMDGDSVFIQGAAGGVGWAATQIARLYKNVTIFGTASIHKHDAIMKNGVDYPLTYDQNVDQEIRAVCPDGVCIVLENMGGESFMKSQEYIRPMGKVILIGAKNMLSGERFSWLSTLWTWWNTKNISMEDLIMNNKCIAGFNLNELLKRSPEKFAATWQQILNLYLEKKIDPKIDSEHSIYDVKAALQRMTDRENIGKIIINFL